jgi:outer membrane immunogenic protein
MHRLVVASLAAAGLSVGLTAAASAADLGRAAPAPVYTKAPMVVPFSWSGFYAGVNAGAGWGNVDDFVTTNAPGTPGIFGVPSNIALVDALGTGSANSGARFTGGGQIGYNWQVSPQWLIGAEADINWLKQDSALVGSGVSTIGPITVSNSVDTHWLATFRARAGLTFDRSLIYVTGGGALTDEHYTQTFSGTFPGVPATAFGSSTVDSTKFGWTVGAGWEQALWSAWSLKAEYLFARFDGLNTATTAVTTTGPAASQNLTGSFDHLDVQVARVGLNYRFGGR